MTRIILNQIRVVRVHSRPIFGPGKSIAKMSAMADLGKLLLTLGAVIAVVGVVLILAGKFNLPVGRLPGDILYRGKNSVFYFPLATCLIISILLSLVLWLINRWRH